MSIDLFDSPDYYPFIAVEGNKVKGYFEDDPVNEFMCLINGRALPQGCNESKADAVMPLIIEWLNNKYFNQQFEADGYIGGVPTAPFISA